MTEERDPLSARALNQQVNQEVARIRQERTPAHQTSQARCRVCRDTDAKRRVNEMLSYGVRPSVIVENLADLNARKAKNAQIQYWSVHEHRKNHFNIQEPEKAAYLRMLEQRSGEDENEMLAQAVGSRLTAKGFLEIIATRGLKEAIKDDAVISWKDGLEAQLKLEELVKDDVGEAERAAMRRDLGLIQQAIREEFSDADMRRLSARLDILRGIASEDDTIEGEIVDDEDDDDEVATIIEDDDEDD